MLRKKAVYKCNDCDSSFSVSMWMHDVAVERNVKFRCNNCNGNDTYFDGVVYD